MKLEERIANCSTLSVNKDLELLGEFLKELTFPVYLVGGIGMALSSGGLYRNNKDIDIMISQDYLNEFSRYASERDYAVCRRLMHWSFKKHDLYLLKKASPKEILQASGKKTRLAKENGAFHKICSRIEYLDVFLCMESEKHIVLSDRDLKIPKEDFFPTKEIIMKNSTTLTIPNPRYFEHIKKFLGRPIDMYDLEKRPCFL